MKIIGITGGAGSGKSEVCIILRTQYNAHIITADKVAHRLMEKGNISYKLIIEYFGESVLNKDKEIDRVKLSQVVFNNKEDLTKLNTFVHPYVKEEILKEIQVVKNEGKNRFIIIEAALLIEDGYKNICDELWYVYAKESIRRKRMKLQRGYSDKKIDLIMKNQLSDAEFRQNTDKLLDNNGTIEDITLNINKILL